ncbi:MAG: glycolate oxidase subunit GlcE [Aestuariivirga sp.]|nr:glycolate oxidase subunit GlcE [Aestuariivirga sp.]
MTPTFKPQTIPELADYVALGGRLEVMGSGTKRALGRPLQPETAIDMSGFTGISLYEPEELVLEAGAGTPLSEIEKALAKNHQQLAFEPPDYSKLLGGKNKGTLGGLMACGLSGPRRIKAGAARDHILGIAGVSGRGEIFKAGGRVVKNVTGFDVAKLMVGSYGTLAALTSITVKVLPAAATQETLVFNGLSDAKAIQAMSLAMQSACDVSGAAHLPGTPSQTLFRLEGIQPSVVYRRQKLASHLKIFGASDHLDEKDSLSEWKAIRDVERLSADDARFVWKLSLTPSKAAETVARISKQLDIQYFYDWAGGLVWLGVPRSNQAYAYIIRNCVEDGHATLFRAEDDVRERIEVFQPQLPALSALTKRVKASFDPNGVFNNGRMYKDI